MKILITGAAGFLGSHIGIKLSKLGYDVYGVDNMIGGDDYNWSWLPREKEMKYVFILLMLVSCSKDISFDPTTTIFKHTIKFIYNESNKEKPVMEIQY